MTPDEFRTLLKESCYLELEHDFDYHGPVLRVKLLSTEDNCSFDPIILLQGEIHFPTRT